MTTAATQQQPAARAVGSLAEARDLAARFARVMETLVEVIEEETKLVRSGHTQVAAALEQRKSELTRLYMTQAAQAKASRAYMRQHTPDLLADLRERHERFRALLQINLTVLATAHAVSEGLVRGVSSELARKSSPQTYTAYGRNAPAPSAVQPMAVSRQL